MKEREMSREPKMTARERLMQRLAQPIPRVKPNPAKEREEIIKHNCEVLNLDPWTHRVGKAGIGKSILIRQQATLQ